MAKKSMIAKNKRPAKFSTQAYTRCEKCGRPHSVYRKFKLCGVCFRYLAYKGQFPGLTKASCYYLYKKSVTTTAKIGDLV